MNDGRAQNQKRPKLRKVLEGFQQTQGEKAPKHSLGGQRMRGGVRSMNTPPPIRAVPKTPNNGLGLGFNQDLLKNALANRRKGVNGSTPEDKNRGGGERR